MPDQVEPGHAAAKLDRLLAEWVDAIIPAGNLLVLKTPPGSANLVANALDAAGLEEVAGTLAGDDTIFVALTDGANPTFGRGYVAAAALGSLSPSWRVAPDKE